MRVRAVLLLGVASLIAAACGTRVPDDAWQEIGFTEEGWVTEVRDGAEADEGRGDVARRDLADEGAQQDLVPGPGSDAPQAGTPGTRPQGTRGQTGPDVVGPDTRQENTASDVGVTPTSIKVGNIVSRGGPLGPHAFGPMYAGANAYFELLNAQGGVNGRRIEFITCDDREEPSRNIRCAQQLVEQEQVFAIVANATRTYAGARYVSENGVPDVGGYPIGSDYWQYPRKYPITGEYYPRDGGIGWKGQLYVNSGWVRWFVEQGITTHAVVHYNVPASAAFASFLAKALEVEGATVHTYAVNFVQPSFDSYVDDMQTKGVEGVWDTLDITGNRNLCASIERRGFSGSLRAKVSTAQSWSRIVGTAFPEGCRQVQYMVGTTRPYTDTSHPQIRTFHDTLPRVIGQREFDERLHQWHLEGWMAAHWFTDGVRQLGANVTRDRLVEWFEGLTDYQADGMFTRTTRPRKIDFDRTPTGEFCLTIVKWDEARGDFYAVAPFNTCYHGTWVAWDPPQGS